MKKKISSGESPKAQNLSARLMAVQGVFQSLHNSQSLKSVLEEYMIHRNPPREEGEPLVRPDGSLLQKIMLGVEERKEDLERMVQATFSRENKDMELLLSAILLCGSYELLDNAGVDAPVIINDYLNVTHAFYEHGEVALVNGILDAIARTVRL